jgi:CHASE2 domain-containing sensor protein
MKDSVQSIRNYVLLGFAMTIILVGIKILIEHTRVGHRLDLFTFEVLESTLSPFNPNEELPIVVLDISKIKENSGQIVDLVKLKDVISALSKEKPRAIGIDVVLTPEEDDAPSDANSRKNRTQRATDYLDFLEYCFNLREQTGIPIFVSVGERTLDKPQEWLGRAKYKDLAVTTILNKADKTRVPIWIKADTGAERLLSLSAAMARSYSKPIVPTGLSWAIETTEEELPGTQRHLDENIEYADAPVNYSKLEAIQQNKELTISSDSIREAGEKFHSKMVLLGDGTTEKAVDRFNIPGRDAVIPGVYVNACAAYTFAHEPLYELNLIVRMALDILLSLTLFASVAFVRLQHLQDKRTFNANRHQSAFTYVVVIFILVTALLLVYALGLLWLDFLLLAIVVWLHPTWEKIVLWLYMRIRKFVLPKKKRA